MALAMLQAAVAAWQRQFQLEWGMQRACVCVCVLSRPWPNTRTEKDSAGQSVASWCRVCRMSCKLAQLIYFNTNLTLISCVLQCAAPRQFPRRLSAIYIVKILSLPYLNMAISYKDLPCVAVAAAGAPAGLIS